MLELHCVGQTDLHRPNLCQLAEQHAAGLVFLHEATTMTTVLVHVTYTVKNML